MAVKSGDVVLLVEEGVRLKDEVLGKSQQTLPIAIPKQAQTLEMSVYPLLRSLREGLSFVEHGQRQRVPLRQVSKEMPRLNP